MVNEMLVAALFWCRAEPVVPNGDDYLFKGKTLEYSCETARHECEKIYSACEFTGCGQWLDERSFDSKLCPYHTEDQNYE